MNVLKDIPEKIVNIECTSSYVLNPGVTEPNQV